MRLATLRHSPLVAGSLAIMATMAVTSLLGIAFWGVATHRLAPRGIGLATVALALASGAALVASQGIQPALIVRLPGLKPAQRPAATEAAVAIAIAVTGLTAVAGVLLARAASASLADAFTPGMAGLAVAAAASQAAAGVVDAACVAERRARYMTLRNAGFAVAKLVAVAIGLALVPAGDSRAGAETIVATWAMANAASTILALRQLHGLGPHVLGPCDLLAQVRGLRGIGSHHLSALGGQLPTVLLPLLVAARLGTAHAAFFNIAWMVGGFCLFLSPAVARALLADGGHEPERLAARARACASLIGIALVPPVLVLVYAGGPLLGLFGAVYAPSGRWLLIAVALSAFPDAVTNIAVTVWRVRGRLTAAWVLNVGMAAACVSSTWLLLPRWGVAAPGWTWLAAQAVGTVAVVASARRRPASATPRLTGMSATES